MSLEKERADLLRRDAEWNGLASQGGDVDTIVSYWTEDAVVLPSGQPKIVGREALRQYVAESMKIPGFRITWKSSDPVIAADGKTAYMFAENTVSMQGPDDSTLVIPGRALTIWRKEADGQWRCAVDMWNAPPG